MGKLPNKELRKLLDCINKDPRVIVPPQAGYDSGVHQMGDKYLVISTDPCMEVPKEWFGWLLIHYAASDVALFGAKPEYCAINLLGSPNTEPDVFIQIMKNVCQAARELGMAIVTGHTGTYSNISEVIGTCTAYGVVDRMKLITPANAKAGDLVFLVKPLGLETVVNFAFEQKALADELFGPERVRKIMQLVPLQSCVHEALALADINGVHAMHDATEGGLLTALNEMADASKLGFKIDLQEIPTLSEVCLLKEYFHLSDNQMLAMSSTGSVLVAVKPDAKNKVEEVLDDCGIEASVLGKFTRNPKRVMIKKGSKIPFPTEAKDPYTEILSGHV